MKSNAKCSRLRLVGLVIGTSLLAACATVSSESEMSVCPHVVKYSQVEQAQAAKEAQALQDGSVIVEMLSDYFVMRDQARSCVG